MTNPPGGFPLYATERRPRVVTSDVWSYMRHIVDTQLRERERSEANAFIDQAFEFFEAADNPLLGSRPLLYYYSFLNLAKMALLVDGVGLPVGPKHGISDPRANQRSRLTLPGQKVRVEVCSADHSQVFPEFVKVLRGDIAHQTDHKVIRLLSQVPGIHRTYCRITGERPKFMPVKQFSLLRQSNEIWVRLVLCSRDGDVRSTLPIIRKRQAFRRVFDQVEARDAGELWFETGVRPGSTRATDTAIRYLAEMICGIGVWPILTAQGHRFYFNALPPREQIPALASIYAVIFYLGSITRYKPFDFEKIVTRKYAWLVGELLKTQPTQFLYGLASHIGGTEVVRPYCAIT